MEDNRRHKRYTLNIAEVNARMMFATEVKVIDISIGGISLKANRRLNIGHEYALKLDDRNKIIIVKGTVVWSSLCESRTLPDGGVAPIYAAGLKLADMPTERVAELKHFIEGHIKIKGHKTEGVHAISGDRFNVRFHLDGADTAVLNIPESYKVREISLGGVLIECPQGFESGSIIPMSLSLLDDELVKVMGRIASCRDEYADGQKRYAIGIEFLNLTDKERQALTTLIACRTFPEDANTKEEDTNQAAAGNMPAISQEYTDKVEHFYKWHKTMGYYKALSVNEWATDQQIKHAYISMAKEFHPDRHPNMPQDLKGKNEVVFAYINEAYSTLMNPGKRKAYDRIPVSRVRH